jgi:hypothetical protein
MDKTKKSMKMINLEVTEESAREMLPILERQRNDMQMRLNDLTKQIQRIRQGLGIATFNEARDVTPLLISEVEKTPHGRIKKGQSKVAVSQFLLKRNGTGATIKEITADTGTSYGTVRRILNELKDGNKATLDSGLWKSIP